MPYAPGPTRLHNAVAALRAGGVVACPTESVWGLSCDPANYQAVDRLLAMKNRPVSKGLILVAAEPWQFEFLLVGLNSTMLETLAATWPGPATWLVPHHDRVPPWVCGEHDTVAIRVSAHPVVAALCRAFGGPLVSTSANPGGAQPAKEAYQVRRYFGESLAAVLPGRVGSSARPTVIRDLASGQTIRH